MLTTDLAARGLDIPEVDLVVQIDPPQDPKQFLHRCGRSGRAGRRGRAVVLLTPGREEDYVPFLKVRKTPIRQITTDEIQPPSIETVQRGLAKMRKIITTDRAVYEKGMRAFVSWVRSYRAHIAASIFRIEDVDWSEVARGWALVKMPRMPELKGQPEVDLKLTSNVSVENIPFKDKAREKQRLQQVKDAEVNADVIAKDIKHKKLAKEEKEKKNAPWSDKTELKEEREVRRGKKRKRRDVEKWDKMSKEERQEAEEVKRLVEEVKKMKKEEQDAAAAAQDDGFLDGLKD